MLERTDWIEHIKEHWKEYAFPFGNQWMVNKRKLQGVLGCSHTSATKLELILLEQVLKDKPIPKNKAP